MALTEKSRSSLYQAFAQIAGEEATAEMLSFFPARDVEEPVTREHLDRRFAELRDELHQSIGGLRTEMHQSIGGLRTEMHQSIGELHQAHASLRAEMHQSIGELRTEMHAGMNRMLVWLMATIIGTAGVAVGATVLLVG